MIVAVNKDGDMNRFTFPSIDDISDYWMGMSKHELPYADAEMRKPHRRWQLGKYSTDDWRFYLMVANTLMVVS